MKKNRICKKINVFLSILIFLGIILNGCDFIDPTQVENPQITDEGLNANPSGGAIPLITGLRSQFAGCVGAGTIGMVGCTEVTSDNYYNWKSFISNQLDVPRSIIPDDFTFPDAYNRVQRVRALADFGISTILPKDNLATANQKAEVYFYKGMALMLLSENFTGYPIEDRGAPITPAQGFAIAVESFKTTLSLTTDNNMKNNCRLALARTYRMLGDKANAEIEAKASIALSANYVFYAVYDATNYTNALAAFLVTRADADYQPLPRLDFLDPKINLNSTSIPQLKSEEAYLILAEVAIANGNLAEAKTQMVNAITLAKSRAVTTFNDRDARTNRPNDATYKCKASPTADTVGGLIQRRGGTSVVNLYSISNTSLTAAKVNAITDQTKLVAALYLLRQEIFFLEGRRMCDLGIRYPVSRREIDANPQTVSVGTVYVPSFIPESNGMDAFTIDATAKTVTMAYDLNQIIADNYATIKPFK